MRATIGVILLLLVWNTARTQEIKGAISYKYLYAKQWDKAIQTYNFSRPFMTELQPLIQHGVNASLSYTFKTSKKLKQGIQLSYSKFRSSAENVELDNTLNLHLLNPGYLLHYDIQENAQGLYTDIILSASLSGLFRKVNGEKIEFDETKAKSFGIGGDLNWVLGYTLPLKNKMDLSPYISLAYTPYHFAPNHEVLINQTKTLASRSWTRILTAQIGLSIHFRSAEKE